MIEIWIGVTSGLFTAFIILGLKILWTKHVLPYWKSITYSGVQIDGSWNHHDELTASHMPDEPMPENPYVSSGKLHLIQKAYAMGGTFVFNYKDTNKDFQLNFDVHGQLWEGYVTLRFTPTDKRVMSYATGMFKICGGGTHMEGQFVFRNVETERVDAIYMAMSRKDEILKL